MTEDRKTLLIFTSSYPYPGNPVYGSFIRDFVCSIKDSIRTVAVTPRFPGTQKTEETEETDGIRIRRFSQCCPSSTPLAGYPGGILPALKRNPALVFCLPFFLFSEFLVLGRTVKQEKVGIIHAHWLIPQGVLAAIWKTVFDREIRLIITCHGSDIHKVNGRFSVLLKRFALKHADEVIAVSSEIQKKVLETAPDIRSRCHVHVRAMGIDTKLFHPDISVPDIREMLKIKGRFILFTGSLIELKGVQALLEGFSILHSRIPDVHLVFAGDGELRNQLEERSKVLGIASSVHFAGTVRHEELPPFFAQCDVFILPSFSEGFSMVVLEALACAAVTVISELPAFLQLDPEGTLFYRCKAGTPVSIATALETALKNPGKNEKGRFLAEKEFSLQKTADFHLNLYRQV